jgi:glutamate synthase (NADPH) large chain
VWLRGVASRHLLETGSAVAQDLLADWDRQVGRFSRIMPRDYRRVLEVTRQAEREGRDVNEAIMEAVRG